jgi:hypothetical protein
MRESRPNITGVLTASNIISGMHTSEVKKNKDAA